MPNLHFRDMLTRKGFDEKQVKSVIRGCRMEAKTGWLMRLVGMPPLPDDLKKRIHRVVELRNCLVHFKAEPTRERSQVHLPIFDNCVYVDGQYIGGRPVGCFPLPFAG